MEKGSYVIQEVIPYVYVCPNYYIDREVSVLINNHIETPYFIANIKKDLELEYYGPEYFNEHPNLIFDKPELPGKNELGESIKPGKNELGESINPEELKKKQAEIDKLNKKVVYLRRKNE